MQARPGRVRPSCWTGSRRHSIMSVRRCSTRPEKRTTGCCSIIESQASCPELRSSLHEGIPASHQVRFLKSGLHWITTSNDAGAQARIAIRSTRFFVCIPGAHRSGDTGGNIIPPCWFFGCTGPSGSGCLAGPSGEGRQAKMCVMCGEARCWDERFDGDLEGG